MILSSPHDARQIVWRKSFPAILFRVANPVEPLDFQFIQDHLLLPLPRAIHDGLRQ